jgi:hypothetical protein
MTEGDDIVVEALLDGVLDQSILSDSVDEALRLLQGGPDASTALERLEHELATVARERSRLLAAIAGGETVAGLLEALRALERREASLRVDRDAIAAQHGLSVQERHRVREELCELAAEWRGVLVDDPTNARPIVSSLLKGRVTFTPIEAHRWRVDGEGWLVGLFSREMTGRVHVPKGNRNAPWATFSRDFRVA